MLLRLFGFALLWRFLGGRRRKQTSREASDRALADVGLTHANLLLGWQLGDSDVLDQKASTLLTADIAAASILVLAHETVGRYWPIPAGLFVFAGLCFYVAIRPRDWDLGDDISDFRKKTAEKPPVAIVEAMIADFVYAVEKNKPNNRQKTRAFRWGYRILALGTLTAISLALAGGPGSRSPNPNPVPNQEISTTLRSSMATPRPLPPPSTGGTRIIETRG